VELVYDEEVCAIIGSMQGRNAHLAEQVATKSRILLLSTWASDPTLSQAYVPWYFRCVPNDEQQAEILYEKVYQAESAGVEGSARVGFYCQDSYDSRSAARAFIRKSAREGKPSPIGSCNDPDLAPSSFLDEMKRKEVDKVLVFGDRELVLGMLKMAEEKEVSADFYTNLEFRSGKEAKLPGTAGLDRLYSIQSGFAGSPEGKVFLKAFREEYGYYPGEMAAYAYDGTRLVLEAILDRGADRVEIPGFLSSLKIFSGVTGDIRFDKHGNRQGLPGM
jgi:branched-chain amino acid transport system substrate-binding protein